MRSSNLLLSGILFSEDILQIFQIIFSNLLGFLFDSISLMGDFILVSKIGKDLSIITELNHFAVNSIIPIFKVAMFYLSSMCLTFHTVFQNCFLNFKLSENMLLCIYFMVFLLNNIYILVIWMDVDVEVINCLLRANMFELRYNFEIWERQVDGSLYPKRMLTGASIYENRIHLRMIKIKQVIVLFI